MDEAKIYKIILADGAEIENLTLNGDNFISKTRIAAEMFLDNCSPVIISDGDNNEIHENVELVQLSEMNGEYWFVLRDIPTDELEKIKMQSDIEYIAMMAGVEL